MEVMQMDKTMEAIKMIADSNNGMITTKQVEATGISRTRLKKYVDNSQLLRIRKGLYILPDNPADEYMLLQARSQKGIFSYGTALYFWGLSDRVPHIIDLTVPQGTNVSRIKKANPQVRFHFIQPYLHGIGKTETTSPQGGIICLYDKERCICDLIKNKGSIEMQLYSQALKDYFHLHANNRQLLKYGKQFGIEHEIRTYIEVL